MLRTTSRRKQRGNFLLESALVFLPMFAIYFGIIDVSFLLFVQTTLSHAAREGARFAVTYSPAYNGESCNSSQAACIAKVVQSNASGLLSGSKASYIDVHYYTVNDLRNPVMTCKSGTCTNAGTLPQTLANGRTVNFANQPGNVIEVSVRNYPWNWLVPIGGFSAGTSLNLQAAASDVLGGLPVAALSPPTP